MTVIGPQSSGKSTLLNYLFGTKFNARAGRCTKGLNAALIRTNIKGHELKELEGVEEILLLDSEGLDSVEKAEYS